MTGKELLPYLADFHIHTVLSPCGELEMGAPEIVDKALSLGISIIAVTDHNSTLNWEAIRSAANERGAGKLLVLPGIEVQTAEDIHVLGIFPDSDETALFQQWIEKGLRNIENDPDIFGYQVVIDQQNQILQEYEILLIQGTTYTLDQVLIELRTRKAIIILAHVDRESFSYPSVLGPIPPDLDIDAVEVSPHISDDKLAALKARYPDMTLLRSSDAHRLSDMKRENCSVLMISKVDFREILNALRSRNGRELIIS